MSLAAIGAATFIGFFVATFLFVLLVRWAALVHGAHGQAAIVVPSRPWPRAIVHALCQSIFHDAPWGLVTLVYIATQIHAEPWAPWLFGGFGAGFGYMVLIAATALARSRARAVLQE